MRLSSWENEIPLNKLFILVERLLNPTRGKYALKCVESHRCEENARGKLACNISTFLRFLEGNVFRKSLTESEWSDQF